MKTFLSIIICSIAALSVSAQTTANATFFAQDGQKFWVIMDGIKQNDKPETNVKVTGLTNPMYRVKIIFADNTIPAIDQSLQTVDYDNKYVDATYNIRKDKKGKMVMRISSFSESTTSASPAQAVVPFHKEETAPVATMPTTNNPTIKQDVVTGPGGVNSSQTVTDPDGNAVKMDMNMGATGGTIKVDDGMGGGVNMNLGINMTGTTGTTGTVSSTTTTTVTQTGSGSGLRPGTPANNVGPNTPAQPITNTPPPANSSNACINPASSTDLGNLKGSIQKQSFSSNKMNVAKSFLKSKCLSVEQIKDVMGLFSFEGDKLEFAKFAYDRCSNKDDYYMVSDAFSFSSSNDELTDYINSK